MLVYKFMQLSVNKLSEEKSQFHHYILCTNTYNTMTGKEFTCYYRVLVTPMAFLERSKITMKIHLIIITSNVTFRNVLLSLW